MSYGLYPSPETRAKAALAPVMSFKTRVVLAKEFPEGYSIGYGRTFITRRPTRIATIPVGYGDGFGWMLSNQGEALVRGKRVPSPAGSPWTCAPSTSAGSRSAKSATKWF